MLQCLWLMFEELQIHLAKSDKIVHFEHFVLFVNGNLFQLES